MYASLRISYSVLSAISLLEMYKCYVKWFLLYFTFDSRLLNMWKSSAGMTRSSLHHLLPPKSKMPHRQECHLLAMVSTTCWPFKRNSTPLIPIPPPPFAQDFFQLHKLLYREQEQTDNLMHFLHSRFELF